MKTIALISAVLLAGCDGKTPTSAPLPQRIIPYSGGLKVSDSGGKEIGFDRTQSGVETAITKLVGSTANDRHNNGPCQLVGWENGLTLVFIDRAFVGWLVGKPVWAEIAQSAGRTCQS